MLFFCLILEKIVPGDFCTKYGSAIPIGIKLQVRNGYQLWVDFVKINVHFVGMRDLFKDFNLRGGESLMFEYVGGFYFKVFIFSAAGSEIEYPLIVHQLQDCLARQGICSNMFLHGCLLLYYVACCKFLNCYHFAVVYPDDGWSFVNYRRQGLKPLNEVVS